MNHKSLKRITKSLEDVFSELKRDKLRDSEIRPRYAEYLTALILAEKGHDVQLLGKRQKKSADIYLTNADARVEVKSACADKDGLKAFKIERKLCRHPEKFRDAWNKIR